METSLCFIMYQKSLMLNIDYSICNDIKVETLPTGRTYFTPDGDYPSITTILGATANTYYLDVWKKRVGEEEAERIRSAAADRGTIVHEYLEQYWSQQNIYTNLLKETSDVQHLTNNLIKATQKNVTEVYAQELALWNKHIGYAGRVDMVGAWRGEDCIIDFKTSRKKKYLSNIKDYYLQVAGYAEAFNILFGTNIEKLVILIAVEDKNVQAFYGNRVHYLPELKYRVNQYRRQNE